MQQPQHRSRSEGPLPSSLTPSGGGLGASPALGALITQPNFGTPGVRHVRAFTPGDDFYEALIDTHRELSDEQSQLLNARLVLLLANHVGDLRVLREALAAARAGV
jgi:hypothetical protein